MFFIVSTITNAQYKLNNGNFWIYSRDYTEEKTSIIDTASFFDSVLYYELNNATRLIPKIVQNNLDTNSNGQGFYRKKKNGFFEHLIIYHNPPDTILIEDKTYKYNAQLGDKWTYRVNIDNIDSTDVDTLWAEVVDIFDGYQFGEWRIIKKITYWSGFADASKYFCDEFGELSEVHYTGVASYLKGCYIDGVAYGDTSFTTVSVQDTETNIDNYSLEQNYPNPFNPSTVLRYQIPKNGLVSLIVYNSLGQVVSKLVDQHQTSGKYLVQFNSSNLSSGVYIYKLHAGEFSSVKKMLLTK